MQPPKNSKFLEKGVLTLEEYLMAGNQLVSSCPTWAWRPAHKSHVNKQLPENQQYLSTRVPCRSRIKFFGQGENGSGSLSAPNVEVHFS